MNVFVTGGSSGIGYALATYYVAHGASLGLVARRESELRRVATALAPAEVRIYPGDVRDAPALADAAHDFVTHFGAPDIVIASAGVSRGTLTAYAEDLPAFRAVFDTNVFGMVATFQPFIESMREKRHGALVGIASIAGFRGLPGAGAYSASKAAAIAYLESLRVELSDSGIAVVTICPGFIDTPLTEKNPYRMPFLMSVDVAAHKIARAIERKKSFYVFPWQMRWMGRALKGVPRPIYDRLVKNRPHKPRITD
jgi:NAD(P)-dependent dehydrogenase (short-subunit alcohol dehydrogenase family)